MMLRADMPLYIRFAALPRISHAAAAFAYRFYARRR